MFFADLDPIIAIAIAIVWAIISAFFKKKSDADEWAEWDESTTKPEGPKPPPQPQQPRPPVIQKPSPHTLDPHPVFPPVWREKPAAPPRQTEQPPPRPLVPTFQGEGESVGHEGPSRQLSNVWEHAGQALAQAHREQERARERLRQLEQRVKATPPAKAHHQAPALTTPQLVARFRSPNGPREAMLILAVLGPPKALQDG